MSGSNNNVQPSFEERLRACEDQLIRETAIRSTHRGWTFFFLSFVIAVFGITGFFGISEIIETKVEEQIEGTTPGLAVENILTLEREAKNASSRIKNDALSASPIRWVTVDRIQEPSELHRPSEYCHFDSAQLDAQLDAWEGWNDRRVLVANLGTGDISIGMIFRQDNGRPDRPSHVRFGAPLFNQEGYRVFEPTTFENRLSDWTVPSVCVVGIILPSSFNLDSENGELE